VETAPKTDAPCCPMPFGFIRRRWDILVLLTVMAVTNGALLFGRNTDFWALYPKDVARGQWWRLITNDYAHGGLRHFFAIGLGFWVVYLSLKDARPVCRLAYVFLSGVGSTLATILFESQESIVGLRGLSGICHGLLAVWALEMILLPARSSRYHAIGGAVLLLVIVKLSVEFATGRPLLTPLYLGHVDSPGVPGHVGGLLAGALAFACLRKRPRASPQQP
jgi:membrane associated rhomboid family serine protease